MALRDQPYIPLYIQDVMTDEKLNECCASTHGIYIKGIMCLMHKSEAYGKILLKQKFKKSDDVCSNFALQLKKHLPYSEAEIKATQQQAAADEQKRFAALKVAFPDDLAFAAEQYEVGASVLEAQAKYAGVLQARLAESQTENTQLKADAEKAAAKPQKPAGPDGAPPLKGEGGEGGEGAAETPDLMDLAKERAGKKGISVGAAIEEIYKVDPDLCEAYRDKITA